MRGVIVQMFQLNQFLMTFVLGLDHVSAKYFVRVPRRLRVIVWAKGNGSTLDRQTDRHALIDLELFCELRKDHTDVYIVTNLAVWGIIIFDFFKRLV